jgi:DNA-binding response OmpR family regulator
MARILVVDDDRSVRQAMRYALEAEGYEVTEAENGRLGEEAHRSRPADVIVLDMHMPIRDGIETLMSLRRAGIKPKVVMVGGDCRLCQTDFLPMVRTLGADATLQKPFVADLLLRVVEDLLAQRPKLVFGT